MTPANFRGVDSLHAVWRFIGLLIALYFLAFSSYWWLMAMYLFWIWVIDKEVSEKGGRPSKWVKSWRWWKYSRDYFPLLFERLPWVELDPQRNYLFCCFPHGLLSTGAFNAFDSEWGGYRNYFPHHVPHMATLSQHYVMPLFRDLVLRLGGISFSAKSIDYVLDIRGGGHVCVLMVGGAAEAYNCKPGNYKVILEKKKCFERLALKNGTPLVPVLSFGETDLFDQFEGSRLRSIQEIFRKWIGLAPVVPIGREFFQYSCGIIPHRCKVTTVVGLPMDIPNIEDPTKEQVDQYHAEFVKRLTTMFEEQKHNYLEHPEDKHLLMV